MLTADCNRNVNGIRNPFSYQPWNTARTFPAMFDILGSDIVVMQELKIQRKDLRDDMVLLDGWDCYFSLPKHKKGYSGVGIYTRNATCSPIRAEEGLLGVLPSPSGVPYCELPEDEHIGGYPTALQVAELGVDPGLLDAEGRCVVVEFPAFVLLGVYSPANSNGLRDDFRYGFICALDCRIRNLVKDGKRVVLVGDLNVSRDERDSASAVEDMRKAGITHEEYISTPNRRIFNQLIIEGEVAGGRDEGREKGVLWDTTRAFHPDRTAMYTHWEQKINARPGNFGSRIDFVLVSASMRSWVKDANIQEGLLGSDHCPVYADFAETVRLGEKDVQMIDLMNRSGTFVDGKRLKDWKIADVPAFSAKRLPEFDKRRSIKSMFAAPALKKSPSSISEKPNNAVQPVILPPPPEHSAIPSASPALPTKANGNVAESTLKRKVASALNGSSAATKRQKADSAGTTPKGQQSLKGFFQRSRPNNDEQIPLNGAEERDGDGTAASSTAATVDRPSTPTNMRPAPQKEAITDTPDEKDEDQPASPASQLQSPGSAISVSPTKYMAQAATIEQSQKSWNNLFARPRAPLCEGHNEPCKTMLTKKKGSNQGRSFWMCNRPLGPSGNKERGTQWRCPTFIWCSDWSTRKGEERDGGNG